MTRIRSGRRSERGSALLITMLLTVAVLAGGAVLVGMQMQATRSGDTGRQRALALHCAEAGLTAARGTVMANYTEWNANLCNPPAPKGTGTCVVGTPGKRSGGGANSEPDFLADPSLTPNPLPGVDHDIDNDGAPDFVITLLDNEDEIGVTNDYSTDNDLTIVLISTCVKFPEVRAQVSEVLKFTPGGNTGCAQTGGCNGLGFFDPNL